MLLLSVLQSVLLNSFFTTYFHRTFYLTLYHSASAFRRAAANDHSWYADLRSSTYSAYESSREKSGSASEYREAQIRLVLLIFCRYVPGLY